MEKEKENEIVVSIKNLCMRFGDREVLKGINLDIYRGQIVGYIGPNGAGKSTTVKIMLGMYPAFYGQIIVLGQDIRTGGIEYKRRIGYVPEIAELYDSLTAQEYLVFIGELYGLKFDVVQRKAQKLLALFGINVDEYRSRISTYSKGMRQKLLIVSSLLHDPEILFFDEPLSGLDANSVTVFKEIMSVLANHGKTIFYSSHIMDVVERISSRIVLINNGTIVADGTFEELLKRSRNSSVNGSENSSGEDKNSENSLEGIFTQLTGFNRHKEIADEFVKLVMADNSWSMPDKEQLLERV